MVWCNRAQQMFDDSYRGSPPWDVSGPKKQFIDLFRAGAITGSVLDIGCGTGELALFFAEQGLEAWGIDFSPRAIRKAEQKAAERGSTATFRVQNAHLLGDLGRRFDTATDAGCFHTFEPRERPSFALSLAAVLRPGGKYFMLCFSDAEPGGNYPRRISQQEIHDTFRNGFTVDSIEPAVFEKTHFRGRTHGWLAAITRTG